MAAVMRMVACWSANASLCEMGTYDLDEVDAEEVAHALLISCLHFSAAGPHTLEG